MSDETPDYTWRKLPLCETHVSKYDFDLEEWPQQFQCGMEGCEKQAVRVTRCKVFTPRLEYTVESGSE